MGPFLGGSYEIPFKRAIFYGVNKGDFGAFSLEKLGAWTWHRYLRGFMTQINFVKSGPKQQPAKLGGGPAAQQL